jgi:hypothetical protein
MATMCRLTVLLLRRQSASGVASASIDQRIVTTLVYMSGLTLARSRSAAASASTARHLLCK